MLQSLSTIKERRKNLEWTQKDLAIRSGVSQSTITKIERGLLVPSYVIAKKIFAALEEGEREKMGSSKKVENIMAQNVIVLSVEDTVKKASELMRRHEISQIPVLRDNVLVGMVTESTILEAFEKYGMNFVDLKCGEIMDAPPPIVRKETLIEGAIELLKQYPALIVMENEKIIGIVTRADIVYLSLDRHEKK